MVNHISLDSTRLDAYRLLQMLFLPAHSLLLCTTRPRHRMQDRLRPRLGAAPRTRVKSECREESSTTHYETGQVSIIIDVDVVSRRRAVDDDRAEGWSINDNSNSTFCSACSVST